jgi:hypothetical protein
MKPNNQKQKSRLALNKQTITQLDAVNMNAVHAGNAAATSLPCIVVLSLTVSCSNCDAQN